jgi:DNA mismatch repair ATPase MutS
MQQYREIKSRHQDAILLFRMGDFYEMFYDDAEIASRHLGLTLTARNNGGAAEVPLAGVPVKAVGEYLRRLVQQGFRVAICEQVEDPKLAKGIVRREVVETVTPGAAFSDDLLDGARNNFLCAIHTTRSAIGIAAADVSTGEFRLTLASVADAPAVLARFAPREVIVPRGEPDRPSRRRLERRARSSPSGKGGSSIRRSPRTSSRGTSACCRSAVWASGMTSRLPSARRERSSGICVSCNQAEYRILRGRCWSVRAVPCRSTR